MVLLILPWPAGQGQAPPVPPAPVCKRSKQCEHSPGGMGMGAGSAPAFCPPPCSPRRGGERRYGGHHAPQGWGSRRAA